MPISLGMKLYSTSPSADYDRQLVSARPKEMLVVHSLRRGVAEAMELIAHGDKKSSRVVGRRLDEIVLSWSDHRCRCQR